MVHHYFTNSSPILVWPFSFESHAMIMLTSRKRRTEIHLVRHLRISQSFVYVAGARPCIISLSYIHCGPGTPSFPYVHAPAECVLRFPFWYPPCSTDSPALSGYPTPDMSTPSISKCGLAWVKGAGEVGAWTDTRGRCDRACASGRRPKKHQS